MLLRHSHLHVVKQTDSYHETFVVVKKIELISKYKTSKWGLITRHGDKVFSSQKKKYDFIMPFFYFVPFLCHEIVF